MTQDQLNKLIHLYGKGYSKNYYASKLNYHDLNETAKIERALAENKDVSPHNKKAHESRANMADKIAESI